ncbi:MAG: hypothetical protein IPL84_02115 [Chitinophagaceae bacterium]|nr:hypothetical protein [Chitinophagaceae bacterium]
MPVVNHIDDVITALDDIITQSETKNDTSGYFAALYRQVTLRVKEGITNNEFEDGPRMEKFDVIFASRYLDAYFAWKNKLPVSASWQKAFNSSTHYWPIVLQHLLMGMNAHINLDLGIAAAEVSQNKNIHDLQKDFNKINDILSSLVAGVQNNLAAIWPRLQWILQKTKGVDDFLVDFSMQLSRDGAWKFALSLAEQPIDSLPLLIKARDEIIAEKSKLVSSPGFFANLVFGIIRLGEKGSVQEKIECLK